MGPREQRPLCIEDLTCLRERREPRASWPITVDSSAWFLQLDVLGQAVGAPEEFEPAFATIVRQRAHALSQPAARFCLYRKWLRHF